MKEVKQINIKNRTYYFYNDTIDLKQFDATLLKIDKNQLKALLFTTFNILQLKTLMIVEIFIVWTVCINVLIMRVDMLKKKNMLTLQLKIKTYLKTTITFLMELEIK